MEFLERTGLLRCVSLHSIAPLLTRLCLACLSMPPIREVKALAKFWRITSNHPEHGTIQVYDLFSIYLAHGEIHLQQIERIKQSFSTIA